MVEVGILRDSLRNGTGAAKGGEISQVGILPTRIAALGEQLIPGFWANGGRMLWFKTFPAFASRTKKHGHFTGGGAN